MSTAADDKRWAIAPPASDDSSDLGTELRVDDRSGSRKRSTGTSPSRQHLTEPAGSAPSEPDTIAEAASASDEFSRESERQERASGRTAPRSSTAALRRRVTLPAGVASSDSVGASSSRELETLAPESSSPYASEPAISQRMPRGQRTRSEPEGGDTIPAPSPGGTALDDASGMDPTLGDNAD